jgi:hypothetical protein
MHCSGYADFPDLEGATLQPYPAPPGTKEQIALNFMVLLSGGGVLNSRPVICRNPHFGNQFSEILIFNNYVRNEICKCRMGL